MPFFAPEWTSQQYVSYVLGNEDYDDRAVVELVRIQEADQMEFVQMIISEWESSEERKEMLRSLDYYKNNTPAKNFTRTHVAGDGKLVNNEQLHNAKLNHPLMRKIVNQKANYALSKPFSIVTESSLDRTGNEKEGETEDIVKEMITELNNNYFTNDFKRDLKNIGRDAIIKGKSWMYINYNEDQKLHLQAVDAENVIPFWRNTDKKVLDALIYYYRIHVYFRDAKTGKMAKKEVMKVQYFNDGGIWYYEIEGNDIRYDTERDQFHTSHFTLTKDMGGNEAVRDVNWEKIPWVCFRDNEHEMPMVAFIGNLLDEYDSLTSTIVNILADIPNSIKVVKNYMGTNREEFAAFLAVYRTAFIRDDGDMKSLETPFDIKSFEDTLNRLRKDIYEGSSTVDTQEASLGNASGVALKFRYADLDSSTDDMVSEFREALDRVIWFVTKDIKVRTGKDFSTVEYSIIFQKDLIIDEEVAVLNAQRSHGIISKRTNLANHPYVENVEEELEYLEEERQDEMENTEEQLQMMEKFGTPSPSQPSSQSEPDLKNHTNSQYPSRSRTAVDKERNSRSVKQVTRQKSMENNK